MTRFDVLAAVCAALLHLEVSWQREEAYIELSIAVDVLH